MVIAEQLFYISLFSECRQQARQCAMRAQSLELLVCARFSLSIIRIVTFVQVKLLLLFAAITYTLLRDIKQTHNTTLFPRQKQDKAEQRYLASIHLWREPAAMLRVDLMELILIWRIDWKEVNQLISLTII